MRYLTENNEYDIQYLSINMIGIKPLICAFLKDRKTFRVIEDKEVMNDTLEKCLMKLGKRLIKKWQNQKK